MSAEERLIRYCQIDTQSDPKATGTPSTAKQFDLARMLKKELEEIGMQDVELDAHCYVYAHLPSNLKKHTKCVGFIAHMDTAPDYTGTGVKPRIIRNYDGKDIPLNGKVTTRIADFPQLPGLKGKDLIVTDGTTLLGADDKAGIAAIMEAMVYLIKHPEIKHGRIAVAFTPDEEIGQGTKFFDLAKFGADFAYTMDGDTVHVMSDETFNAASAKVVCTGFTIHPGEAKNKMINACNVAHEFHSLLPAAMRPEHTEKREGFFHLIHMQGNTDQAVLEYIIRNHDRQAFMDQIALMKKAAAYVNQLHGSPVIKVTIKQSYRNMREVLQQHPEVAKIAWQAIQDIGLTPENVSIRGGTDGAELSFRGLPCPNLGTGGGNYHGRYEYCVIQELHQAMQLIVRTAQLAAGEGKA